ncbi:MAG: DMT family transporter [Paludibacter sp.]|nr:DMT family transporter [Paludibacter sp.]
MKPTVFSKSIIVMMLASLSWSASFITIGLALQSVNASTMIFLRWLLAVIVLIPVGVLNEGLKLPNKQNLLPLIGMGLFNVVIMNLLMFEAYKTTTPTNVAFISALNPVLIAFWAFIFLKEKLGRYKIVGGIIALIGVIIVLFKGDINTFLSIHYRIGDVWMFIAVASHGLYAICAKVASKTIGSINAVIYAGIFGIILYLPFSFSKIKMPDWNYDLAFYVFITGVVGTGIAQWFFINSVKHIGATASGIIINFNPVFTVLLSGIFLNQIPVLSQLIGWVIIMLGIILFYKRPLKSNL